MNFAETRVGPPYIARSSQQFYKKWHNSRGGGKVLYKGHEYETRHAEHGAPLPTRSVRGCLDGWMLVNI